MELNQIQELIRMVSRAKLTEFILKEGDFKLIIRNQTGKENMSVAPVIVPAAPPVVATAPAAPPAAAPKSAAPASAAPADENANLIAIKSPMVGTFYRSSGPDKPAFVKVGDVVGEGDTVCIIEAMKLFNEIESDVKGKIVKVLVEDASPVEYEQALFLLEPA